MNTSDTEKLWRMAITNIQYGQDNAVRLRDLLEPSRFEAAMAKIDSALLDLEGFRDVWRRENAEGLGLLVGKNQEPR